MFLFAAKTGSKREDGGSRLDAGLLARDAYKEADAIGSRKQDESSGFIRSNVQWSASTGTVIPRSYSYGFVCLQATRAPVPEPINIDEAIAEINKL